jgi:hypothetical protein
MQRIRGRLTYANVMATIAVFLVLGGGSAVALSGSNTVFSDDIVDNQVKTADVRNDTLKGGGLGAADLKPGSVGTSEVAADALGSEDLAPSSVGTSEVANGSIQPDDLAAAARGARAYAYGGGASCPGNPVVFCPISRGKGVAYIVKVATGKYCVGVTGISAADPDSVALVAPEVGGVSEQNGRFAMWQKGNSACVSQEFEIRTQTQPVTEVRFSNGSCCADVSGVPQSSSLPSFVIVIP